MSDDMREIHIEIPEELEEFFIADMFGFPDFPDIKAKEFEVSCMAVGRYLLNCNKMKLDPGIYQMVLGSVVAALPNTKICKDLKKCITQFLKEGISNINSEEDLKAYMNKKDGGKK